jgi:Trk K+ transport system NAD-binding subunit
VTNDVGHRSQVVRRRREVVHPHVDCQGDVQEIEVTSDDIIGKPVSEVGPMLPDACLIALVSRNGDVEVPSAGFVIERGDHVTLPGRRDSVRVGMQLVDPDGTR